MKKKISPGDPSMLNLEIKVLVSSMYDHEVAAEIERRIRNVLLMTSDKIEELLQSRVQKNIIDEELTIRVTAELNTLEIPLKKTSAKATKRNTRKKE